MKVLVCGSRDWDDWDTIWQTLDGIYINFELGHLTVHAEPFELIHGDARGADRIAKQWAMNSPLHSHNEGEDDMEFIHTPVPAKWAEHGRAAGPIRNRKMLDMKPDLVVAFKNDFHLQVNQGGTEHMVLIAEDAGIPLRIISTRT